ncbi:MAG: hypothetical protein K0R19_2355 [Bacillota bacterium]|jgi:hypothetical protein|nr:hypothetical protein [Bacillota bacterium]
MRVIRSGYSITNSNILTNKYLDHSFFGKEQEPLAFAKKSDHMN